MGYQSMSYSLLSETKQRREPAGMEEHDNDNTLEYPQSGHLGTD